jgi:TatD DNase family protein
MASRETLNVIEAELGHSDSLILLHWFTGDSADFRRAIDLHCLFSVNAQMLQSDRTRKRLVKVPKEKVLLETDGPFTRIHERPSEPSELYDVLPALGTCWGESDAEVKRSIASTERQALARFSLWGT